MNLGFFLHAHGHSQPPTVCKLCIAQDFFNLLYLTPQSLHGYLFGCAGVSKVIGRSAISHEGIAAETCFGCTE